MCIVSTCLASSEKKTLVLLSGHVVIAVLYTITALTDPKLFGVSESQHLPVTEQNMIFYLLYLPFSSLKQIKKTTII